jgi:hypothetical protein
MMTVGEVSGLGLGLGLGLRSIWLFSTCPSNEEVAVRWGLVLLTLTLTLILNLSLTLTSTLILTPVYFLLTLDLL